MTAHIPDTASPILRAARADAWAGNAIADEWIRKLTAERDAMIAAEVARRGNNGHADTTNQKGRPQS